MNVGEDEWILGNVEQYGYYRVNYDDANWKSLIQQLRSKHTVRYRHFDLFLYVARYTYNISLCC